MSIQRSEEEFLNQKTFAVVGVSSDRDQYGNIIFRELKQDGVVVYPVNPHNAEIEGNVCYPSLHDLPQKADGIVVVVPPVVTEKIVREAHEEGIERVWMQPGAQSADAVDYCKDAGIDCIAGRCILVSLQKKKRKK